MAMGCWSEQELVGEQGHWQAKKLTTDASEWEVLLDGEKVGEVKWSLVGEHNMHNGLMAIAAARHVGVAPADAANALGVRLLTLVVVWSCAVKRMASRYMMILPSPDGDSGNAGGAAWQSWWYGAHYCRTGTAL